MEFVIPNGNEGEFISVATKLGISKLVFLYNIEKFNSFQNYDDELIDIEIGYLINPKKKENMLKAKYIVAKSSKDDRELLESKRITHIFGFEDSARSDFMHQRLSGLNHILCDIARKNNITISFSYCNLNDPILLGRMMQNIKLCRKYKTKLLFTSFATKPFELRTPHDVQNLINLISK